MIELVRIKQLAIDAVFEHQSVQLFLDRVYAEVHLPMICFDTSFRHLAHAFEHPFYHSAWEEISKSNQATEANVIKYNYLAFQEQIVAAGKPILINSGRNADYPSVNCAICRKGKLVAYCGIMVENESVAAVEALNDILCKTISILWDETPGIKITDDFSTFLMVDNATEADAEALNQAMPSPYFMAMLSPVNCGVSTMRYVQHYIEDHVGNCISASVDNGDIFALFYGTYTDDIMQNLQKSIDLLGKRYSFKTAFSCSFFDAVEIPMRRRQAQLVMNIGRYYYPNKNTYFIRFLYSNIIAYYGAQALSPELILTPELRRLQDAAPNRAIHNFRDVFIFLYYFGNYQIAAEKLGIHKNTLIYRISRIAEIAEIDFSDSRTRERLLLSLSIWLLNENAMPEGVL